jgi:KDO2-lipid IV(A) lauroyltransferase
MAQSMDPKLLKALSPYYWPTWLGVVVLRGMAWLPYPLMLRVGRAIGGVARWLAPRQCWVVRRNLELCLPEWSDAQRHDLLVAHFRALGESLCDFAMTWWSPDARIRSLCQVEGIEHLDAALAKGRGAIVLTGHFTTLEISARILTTLRPVSALFKTLHNPALAFISERGRARHAARAIPYDDIRGMIAALRRNEAVWYAPDQSFRKKGAVLVKLFGVPAPSNPNTTRLAELTGAPVLYMSHERLPDAAGYRMVIHAPMDNFPSGDGAADLERLHACIEADMRRTPAQYWWIHRRFKPLTAGDPDPYARQ